MARIQERTLRWLAVGAAATAFYFAGCNDVEKAAPRPKSIDIDRSIKLDVPQVMTGTIAAETIILGYEPVLVRGYGLVVGLNGTGHRGMPQDLRAHMLAMALQNGVGSASRGAGEMSPEALLDSMDTAVVVVEGLIPPGSKKDSKFDVRVFAHPATAMTSLEGGQLWTAEVRPVIAPGLPPTGSRQARGLAIASGPIFINPFADPGAVERDTIVRTRGRIMNGGTVLEDMTIKMRVATPSHSRARSLQSLINAQFPQEPTQREPTARGLSDEGIEITIPPSYQDRTEEFVEILRHTTLSMGEPERVALRLKRLVETNPGMAAAASWRWQALGERAVPIIRDLYEYPEERPRLAALRAGAKLDDPLAVPHLISLANTASVAVRGKAIELMGEMDLNPRIDVALRELLQDEDVEIRLSAYEALVKRFDPSIDRFSVDQKFIVDVVHSDKPMIYITQLGEPRIAIFGPDLEIERPIHLSAWSDRFMIKGDAGDKLVEVYYRADDEQRGEIVQVKPSIVEFVRFLGHTTTVEQPAPGLGLTYAQAVGALHQIYRQRYVKADFKAEQDRLLAAILERERGTTVQDRPEFDDGSPSDDADSADGATAPTEPSGEPTASASSRGTGSQS